MTYNSNTTTVFVWTVIRKRLTQLNYHSLATQLPLTYSPFTVNFVVNFFTYDLHITTTKHCKIQYTFSLTTLYYQPNTVFTTVKNLPITTYELRPITTTKQTLNMGQQPAESDPYPSPDTTYHSPCAQVDRYEQNKDIHPGREARILIAQLQRPSFFMAFVRQSWSFELQYNNATQYSQNPCSMQPSINLYLRLHPLPPPSQWPIQCVRVCVFLQPRKRKRKGLWLQRRPHF